MSLIKREQLNTRMLVTSLRGTVCPACGGPKNPNQTMCRREYFRLPQTMRKAIYNRIGDGYEDALVEALNYLGVTEFHEAAAIGG
jgi:hypothetical protein